MKTITLSLEEYEKLLEENKKLRESYAHKAAFNFRYGTHCWEDVFYSSRECLGEAVDGDLRGLQKDLSEAQDEINKLKGRVKELAQAIGNAPRLFGYRLVEVKTL